MNSVQMEVGSNRLKPRHAGPVQVLFLANQLSIRALPALPGEDMAALHQANVIQFAVPGTRHQKTKHAAAKPVPVTWERCNAVAGSVR